VPHAEENKATVRACVEAFHRGDVEALRKRFTSDALVYGVLGRGGMDEVVPGWQQPHSSEWFLLRDGKIHRSWGARDSASQTRRMELKPL
jgi:hypothetical protein